MADAKLIREAKMFGKYIIGIPINDEVIEFYCQSLKDVKIDGAPKQTELLNKCINSPRLLPYYDAALSVLNPEHLIKKRLMRMFAILETRTEYTEFFLGKEFSKFYMLKITWVGIRAVFKTLVGIVIIPRIKVIQNKNI
ncbi:MAG: hypothetical protein DRI86_09470 [Bacteroidetes bacterium]|nr:MAG: hypothetical protein DRI86_09470 [Bacteroidota bacterium]